MTDTPAWLAEALDGRYAPERELGRGGMAIVYLAMDLRHRRRVAIKVLHPSRAETVETERFLREIQTAAQLVHPNILALHDSGEAGRIPYYVMPYVEGESLADRLERDGTIPLRDAVRLACEIASALAFAHARGIVHRDIKPGNILLVDGTHATVADFGLAHALSYAGDQRLTLSGYSVGSPLYMSPEQVAGGNNVDGRSDVYSLGCLFYEMLTGRAPFARGTVEEVLSRHMVEPPPSPRSVRQEVPHHLDRLVRTMMAKRPADRPDAARVEALLAGTGRAHPVSITTSTLVPRWLLELSGRKMKWGGGLAAACLAAVVAFAGLNSGGFLSMMVSVPAMDNAKYLLLPLIVEGDSILDVDPDRAMRDALVAWQGIAIVDRFSMADILRDVVDRPLSERQARRHARELGAGRWIRGSVASAGEGLRVQAALYSTDDVVPLWNGEAVVSREDGGKAGFEVLAEALLFGVSPATVAAEGVAGTRSVPARRAYLQGAEALGRWDLPAADSLLRTAVDHDESYASAHLWLAQLRSWLGEESAVVAGSLERATLGANNLSLRERTLAVALQDMLDGRHPEACARYEALLASTPRDEVATFGLAKCHISDRLVVRDRASRSGWRFRGSFHRGVQSFTRLFALDPAAQNVFRPEGYRALREVLVTSTSNLQGGVSAEGERFAGILTFEGDTLAMPAYPLTTIESGQVNNSPEVVTRQRQAFYRSALAWVRTEPGDDAAYEALAVSQELLGDSSALQSIRRARDLVVDTDAAFNLAIADVWLRIKFGAPGGGDGLRSAKTLADSLLGTRVTASPHIARRLASLAILTGKPHLSRQWAAHAAEARSGQYPVPLSLARLADEFMAYAAAGGPVDSIRSLEQRVATAIRNTLDPRHHAEAEKDLIGRAATIAFPSYRSPRLPGLKKDNDYLLNAQVALMNGDTASVRRTLTALARSRESQRPSDLKLDAVYPEAALLAEIGDEQGAVAWLDPVLEAVRWFPPGALESVPSVGGWVGAKSMIAQFKDK